MNGVPSSLLCCCGDEEEEPPPNCQSMWIDCPEELYISFGPSGNQYIRQVCDGSDIYFTNAACDDWPPPCKNSFSECPLEVGTVLKASYREFQATALKFRKQIKNPGLPPQFQRVIYEAVEGPEQTGTVSMYQLEETSTNLKGEWKCGEPCDPVVIRRLLVNRNNLPLTKEPGDAWGGSVTGKLEVFNAFDLAGEKYCRATLQLRVSGFWEDIVTINGFPDVPEDADDCQLQASLGCPPGIICEEIGPAGIYLAYRQSTTLRLRSDPPRCPASWFTDPTQIAEAWIDAGCNINVPFTQVTIPFGPCPPLFDPGDGYHDSSSCWVGGITSINTS